MAVPLSRPVEGGFSFSVIRSGRRSLAIEITQDRQVLVRVPHGATDQQVRDFVNRYRHKVQQRLKELGPLPPEPDQAAVDSLVGKARRLLPPLVDKWAKAVGVSPQGLTITGARTRFGSCSSKGRLCFSYRLMAYPMEAIEYVVLHEVCHLKQLNHGKGFYALLDKHMPDHKGRRGLLRRPPSQEET